MIDSEKIYKKIKISDELINNLKRLCMKDSEDKLIELAESLGKLSITGNLTNLFKEIFNEEKERMGGLPSNVPAIILIWVYKYNPEYFDSIQGAEDNFCFSDLNFMKNFVKSQIAKISISSSSKENNNTITLLNYIITLMFLLILKFKFSQTNYQFIDEIIKFKNFAFNNDTNSEIIDLTNEFLQLSLNVNTLNHYSKNLDFIFSRTKIFEKMIKLLNKDENFSEISMRPFKGSLTNNSRIPIGGTSLINKDKLSQFLVFNRHKDLIDKIREIYSFNNEQKLLFYGSNSSGKTTFAKIFTEGELLIDIDETIEVNTLLGGYLINEFSEIMWQDGVLLKALKDCRDIIFRNMEKCSNELFFILKQIVEKNSFFLNIKQELITFEKMPKLVFIYNSSGSSNEMIFNFLNANTFPIKFDVYSDEEKIQIALTRCSLGDSLFKTINEKFKILEDILEVYRKVVVKYKFNTRFREINLADLIKFSARVETMLNSGIVPMTLSNIANLFISERNKVKIVSTFLYMSFFTLEDFNLIKNISQDFAEKFNFDPNNFSKNLINFNDMFTDSDSSLNYIQTFSNDKISFDHLARQALNTYSYNNNSKFYIKLINECIINTSRENVLLVGETGVGKTTMIQNLARIENIKLNVINLSQSSDVSELFGGFKPIHPQIFLQKYFEKIVKIIQENFNASNNKGFISSFYEAYSKKDTEYFIKFTMKSIEKLESKLKDKKVIEELSQIKSELVKFKKATKRGCYNAFTYMDGILLDALKKDEWILLDEINLANDDLLLKLSPILEGQDIFLVENEELKVYKRGPKFRIFGSMNPEYNIGKKRLPSNLRAQFSEIFVHEIKEFHDIKTFVKTYLQDISCDDKFITEIAKFYMFIKDKQYKNEIQKQNYSKCNFSLRTLSRALITIKMAVKFYDIQTAISESLHMNFLSLLNDISVELVKNNTNLKLDQNLINNRNNIKTTSESFVNFSNYFIQREFINQDLIDKDVDSRFILTKTFKNHLNNLMRIITLSDYAVLLEGPTSVGKTSIVEYIGKKIGQKVLRINNNQNTEIEEYIGNYTTDSKGQFYFQEGFLVKAVQEGSWIILDEINLAPSEVLEALNRLLDDNRELFISELNKTIKAHPNFKIFAAMNPAELYGGRKDLSEAFKNRFIHLYFDNIPEEDLEEIIEKRCKLAKSRVKIMVGIFTDLQKVRSSEKVFSKKEGFITIRDLIKWGSRTITSYEDLAYEGFFVIAEKIRNEEEKLIVQKIIEKNIHKHSKNLKLDFDDYFNNYVKNLMDNNNIHSSLCLNKSTKRMVTLIDKCLKNKEPVLLIGETGTGKTVVCEFIAQLFNKQMITINCHENVDTSDFLGSLRSVYGREDKIKTIRLVIQQLFEEVKSKLNETNNEDKFAKEFLKHYNKYFDISSTADSSLSLQKCEKLTKFLNKNFPSANTTHLSSLLQDSHKLFEWMDGPLTVSMRKGNLLLIDEISLAQDSVLERLNSVFEADRVLVLSEKQSQVEVIYPSEEFMVIASMTPSGDHGKRELSPALRSRFSEIYIDINNHLELNILYDLGKEINNNDEFAIIDITHEDDIYSLIIFKISSNSTLTHFLNENQNAILVKLIYHLLVWFNFYLVKNQSQIVKYLTLRDVDTLLDFFIANLIKEKDYSGDTFISLYYHSVNMTLLDGIFLNESSKPEALIRIKNKLINFLDFQIGYMHRLTTNGTAESINFGQLIDTQTHFGITPFFSIEKSILSQDVKFIFHTENIKMNLLKILRGLTTGKPILIEGSPGVGKTTIIQNLARKLGKNIYRINLSEHTDMIDLIGSEYPTDDENSKGITFKWVDGVFLKALVNGDWIIIDEMNLASQSILEGLNGVLDYRKTLFVPELNKGFKCHNNFQIFATQNPVNQGGGRKFLPKSFLNRFVKIYLNDLSDDDYNEILHNLFPSVDMSIVQRLTHFNNICQNVIYDKFKLNMNEVGEFNLRTLTKILEVYTSNKYDLKEIIKLLYISRIRRSEVRGEIRKEMNTIFADSDTVDFDMNKLNICDNNVNTCNYTCNKIPYIENNSVGSKHSITVASSVIQKYSDRLKLCIENNFPVIITGNSAIGKKEIVRHIAKLTNSNLYEFSLNSSMDSTELLGNFDKINISYHLKNIREKVASFINNLHNIDLNSTELLQLLNLVDILNKKLTDENNTLTLKENFRILKDKLNSLNLLHLIQEDIHPVERVIDYIQNDTFNFEWHDSTLVHCIINGHWIILDNVNTCSAAVLDRLNSLLDDDKQIYLNECGSSEGRVVKPHPNFRIFMVMNQKFGEVSRALKNRCVEIYFDKDILNVSYCNREHSEFDAKVEKKMLTISFADRTISLRKKTFDDLIKICEAENLLSYQMAFKLCVGYLYCTQDLNHLNDFRSFKKFSGVFYFYYCNKFINDFATSFENTANLVLIKNNFINARDLFSQIEDYYMRLEMASASFLTDEINNIIFSLRFQLDISLSSSDLVLFDCIFKQDKFSTLFHRDFNKLISKNEFLKNLMNNDNDYLYDALGGNISNKSKSKLEETKLKFNNLLLSNLNDKVSFIYERILTNEEISRNLKDIVNLNTANQNFIRKFSQNYLVFLVYAFLSKEKDNSNNANNENNSLCKLMENNEKASNMLNMFTKGNINPNENLINFYLNNLKGKNFDKQMKKLISAKYEDNVESVFNTVYNLLSKDNINIPSIVISIVEFLQKTIEDSSGKFIKYLQLNPETFFFITTSIIEKYTSDNSKCSSKSDFKKLYKKLKQILPIASFSKEQIENLEDKISMINFDNKKGEFISLNTGTNTITIAGDSKKADQICYFDSKFLLNLPHNQLAEFVKSSLSSQDVELKLANTPLMNMILLEFDVKSAKTFSDILNIKYYHTFIEKVNEVLSNERLIIPIISNPIAMKNIQTFTENLINYSSYLNDYSIFGSTSDEDFINCLFHMNFFNKLNIKHTLDKKVIEMIQLNQTNALLIHLIRLFLQNEYSGKNSVDKITFLSNDIEAIKEHFEHDYKKLFFVPFYYFFSKTYVENVSNNFRNFLKVNKLGNKIKMMEAALKAVEEFVLEYKLENENVEDLDKISKLQRIIKHAELLVNLTIPDKTTISKILGKDLFKLFYEIVLENKEKLLFSDKLIYDAARKENYSNYNSEKEFMHKKANELNSYRIFREKLTKFEKECFRGENANYDHFIKDLSAVIQKFYNIKDNHQMELLEELKISLVNIINRHLLYFGDIILPFTLALFIYINAVQACVLKTSKIKLNNKKFLQQEEGDLFLNFLHRLPTKMNLPYIISSLKSQLNLYSEKIQQEQDKIYSQSEDSLFILREKLKLYEDVNMKVLESTNAMDELSKDAKEKLREEEEKKEIEENFPTYASDFKNYDKLELIDLTKNINIKNSYGNSGKNNKEVHKSETLYQLYKIFEKHLFISDSETPSSENVFSLNYYFTRMYSATLKNKSNMSISEVSENIFYFYRIKSEYDNKIEASDSLDNVDKISARKEEQINLQTNYHFYKDPNPREIKLLYISLNNLLEKTSTYLKDYPDHPLLVLIVIITFNLLELNINSTPLSKVLSGLDVLLSKLQEWETYASKKINSLKDEIKLLMMIIRRFRKIEILSWRSLLNSKMLEYEKRDCLNYFDYLLKILHLDSNTNVDETLDTLNMFIMNSNFSSFKFRVNCLKILSKLLEEDKEKIWLVNSLNNIYNYYTINFFHTDKFNQFKQNQLTEIEAKVKDLSNIAKWDIKNYFGFRDNMKRNYKQLNKILKGFDSFCLTNVKEFIEFSRSEFTTKDYVMTKFKATEEDNDPKDIFDSIATEIFSRLDTLRNIPAETKSKVFKHKALIDLIKTLKLLGFSTVYKFYQKEVYLQFKLFDLDFITSYENYFPDAEVVYKCKKASAYVVKILEKINNFNIVDNINEDLNMKYLDTMKGLAYSSYFKCLLLFAGLEKMIRNYARLSNKNYLQKQIGNPSNNCVLYLSSSEVLQIYKLVNTITTSIHMSEFSAIFENKEENSKLKENLNIVITLNENYHQFVLLNSEGETEDSSNVVFTDTNKEVFRKFIIRLESIIRNDIMKKIDQHYILIRHKVKEDVKEFYSTVEDLIIKINTIDERESENEQEREYDINKNYMTQVVENLLQTSVNNEGESDMDVNIMNKDNFQNIFENFFIQEQEGEEEESNKSNNEEAENVNLKIDDLLSRIESANNFYLNNLSNPSSTNLKTMSTHISQLSDLTHSTLKLTNLFISIFYNVSLNGFCQQGKTKPDSGKDSDSKGGVHEGGFGMAEGQGVEDISKEIEDEEQLLGLKEDKKEDQEEPNKDDKKPFDKKSGFEMTTDFKEDERKELSEDEEEEEHESNDEEDVEREKDNVDNAKDNKMFDKDNEIEDDKEEKPQEEDRGKVDLTDKSVSMNKREKDKDNSYKAKEKESKGKDRTVDKPEEEEKDNVSEEDDNNNSEKDFDKNNQKVEKLEVDQKEDKMDVDEPEAEPEAEAEEQEGEQGEPKEDQEGNLNNENNEENPNQEETDQNPPDQDDNADLLGEQHEVDLDADNQNEEDSPMADEDNQDDDALNKKQTGENQDNDQDDAVEPENDEELFKSKPLPTKTEDLGYNPISKNKGSGGNTAQKSADNNKNPDQENENENDKVNKDQLESLDKYEEIFDLNSMLESVWKTRPSRRNPNKSKEINKLANKQEEPEPDCINDDNMNVEENFDFQNKPETEEKENEKEKNNNNNNENADFDQGYADNQNNQKKASGYEDNEQNKNRKHHNKEEEEDYKSRRVFENREEEMNIDNKEEDNMVVEKEKEENSLKNYESDEDQMQIDDEEVNKENNFDDYIKEKQNNLVKNALKMELDKDIQDESELPNNDNKDSEETLENMKKMESDIINDFGNWIKSEESSSSIDLWNKMEQVSINHINKLIEHLKIALEPNKQTKLRGNYKSGKRLNIKKIISFIASNYRNDKIWLRRTLPFERNYYVTLAIDDSLSMKEHNLGFFAMESLVIVSTALNKAGIGKICICGIKEDMEVYHNYNEMFNREKGSYLLSKFKFDFSSRLSHDVAMTNFMKHSLVMLENLMKSAQGNSTSQIVFILSDGRFNKDNVRSLCMEAKEKGFLYVFIILDKYGIDNNNSIMNMNSVKHVYKADGDYDIEVKPYLEDFPFSYYVIVEDSSDLPGVIQTILVKWFTINSIS